MIASQLAKITPLQCEVEAEIKKNLVPPLGSLSKSRSSNDDELAALFPTQLTATKYNLFLDFVSNADEKQYRRLMKKQIYVPLIPFMIFTAAVASTHAFFTGLLTTSPYFIAGFGFYIAICGALTLIFSTHLFVGLGLSPGTWRYKYVEYVLYRLFYGEIESLLNVLIPLCIGCYMTGRVEIGSCYANTNDSRAYNRFRWNDMGCNPEAASHAPPADSALMLFLVPVCCQIFLKGVSRTSSLLAWCISSMFYIANSAALNNKSTSVWFQLIATCCLLISYELERYKRDSFLQAKQSMDEALAAQSAKHDREMHILEYQKERAAFEIEHEHMRSLIGNVAHDLKTPLQAMTMDIESLRVALTTSYPINVLNEMNTVETSQTEMLDHITSLQVSASFMKMAINRAIDYTKASSNIALVPKIDSFDIEEVINDQVAMINHMQNSVKVNVVPFGGDMCRYVMSDRHWLAENMLCLLSNAVKYSDGGCVRVIVSLLDETMPTGFATPKDAPRVQIAGDRAGISLKNSNRHHGAVNAPQYVYVTVEDTGIGLDESERAALFRPFKQAQRYAGGTGLGLYSLSKRVDALGGSYGVSGRSDGLRGSSFWFTIPYRPDESFGQAISSVMATPSFSSSSLKTSPRYHAPSSSSSGGGGAGGSGSGSGGVSALASPKAAPRGANGKSVRMMAAIEEIPNVEANSSPSPQLEQKHDDDEKPQPWSSSSSGAGIIVPALGPPVKNPSHPGPSARSGCMTPRVLRTLRVLVVDDALTILKVVGKHLEREGHKVETAKNGFVGLNRMTASLLAAVTRPSELVQNDDHADEDSSQAEENQIIDLVLMDLQMPVMDGLEAVRRYRAVEYQHQGLPTNKVADGSSVTSSQRQSLRIRGASASTSASTTRRQVAAFDPMTTFETTNGTSNVDDLTDPSSTTAISMSSAVVFGASSRASFSQMLHGGAGGSYRLLIVGMSANSDSESKRLAKEVGMDYFLEKPFSISDFNKLLVQIYARRAASGDEFDRGLESVTAVAVSAAAGGGGGGGGDPPQKEELQTPTPASALATTSSSGLSRGSWNP